MGAGPLTPLGQFRHDIEVWCLDECASRRVPVRLRADVVAELNRALDARARALPLDRVEVTIKNAWQIFLQKFIDEQTTPDEKIAMLHDRDLLEAIYRKLHA